MTDINSRLVPKIKYKDKLCDIVHLYDPDVDGKWREATIRDEQGNLIEKVRNFEIIYVIEEIAKELGKRGGEKTKTIHGHEHFKKIGLIGAKKRWQVKKDV